VCHVGSHPLKNRAEDLASLFFIKFHG
jgi:hypothetical protein